MRLSDILYARVVDRDDRALGRVVDVRLVQDGPVRLPYGAALRVDGLIVAERPGSRLLGYEGDVRPAIFRRLVRLSSGRVRYVSFDRVRMQGEGVLRADERAEDLALLDDVPPRTRGVVEA